MSDAFDQTMIFKRFKAAPSVPDPLEDKRAAQIAFDEVLTPLGIRAPSPEPRESDADYIARLGEHAQGCSVLKALMWRRGFPPAKMSKSIGDNPNRRLSDAGICDDNDETMPSVRLCNEWLKNHQDFNILYGESIRDRLKIFEEEVVKIADDMTKDFKTIIKKGREIKVPDPDMVMRAKLRIEVRFRHLKAGMPQKWGDISTVNMNTSDPLDAKNLSMDELERRIGDIESKSHRRPCKAA